MRAGARQMTRSDEGTSDTSTTVLVTSNVGADSDLKQAWQPNLGPSGPGPGSWSAASLSRRGWAGGRRLGVRRHRQGNKAGNSG